MGYVTFEIYNGQSITKDALLNIILRLCASIRTNLSELFMSKMYIGERSSFLFPGSLVWPSASLLKSKLYHWIGLMIHCLRLFNSQELLLHVI